MTKNKVTKKKNRRLPRHTFDGTVTWRRFRYPKNGNREHGKLLQLGLAFTEDIPESVLKQAKRAGRDELGVVKKSLGLNKKYKNRTVWLSAFESYIDGDFNVDVGDEVSVVTTLKFNKGKDDETYANFNIKEIELVESAVDFDDEDVEDMLDDDDSEELD